MTNADLARNTLLHHPEISLTLVESLCATPFQLPFRVDVKQIGPSADGRIESLLTGVILCRSVQELRGIEFAGFYIEFGLWILQLKSEKKDGAQPEKQQNKLKKEPAGLVGCQL